jgi:hypothetical protein
VVQIPTLPLCVKTNTLDPSILKFIPTLPAVGSVFQESVVESNISGFALPGAEYPFMSHPPAH